MTGAEALTAIMSYPAEFELGFDEGLDGMGMTYDDDPTSPRSTAYDLGRSLRLGIDVA